MPQDTRIALFLIGELVAALRANDPDVFKGWLSVGIQDLGEPEVEELRYLCIKDGETGLNSGRIIRSQWVAPKEPKQNPAGSTLSSCVMVTAPPSTGNCRHAPR